MISLNQPDHINISLDNMFEEFKNTCGKRSEGVQIPVAKQSQICGHVRYEHNFSSNKPQSALGNISLKVNW